MSHVAASHILRGDTRNPTRFQRLPSGSSRRFTTPQRSSDNIIQSAIRHGAKGQCRYIGCIWDIGEAIFRESPITSTRSPQLLNSPRYDFSWSIKCNVSVRPLGRKETGSGGVIVSKNIKTQTTQENTTVPTVGRKSPSATVVGFDGWSSPFVSHWSRSTEDRRILRRLAHRLQGYLTAEITLCYAHMNAVSLTLSLSLLS